MRPLKITGEKVRLRSKSAVVVSVMFHPIRVSDPDERHARKVGAPPCEDEPATGDPGARHREVVVRLNIFPMHIWPPIRETVDVAIK